MFKKFFNQKGAIPLGIILAIGALGIGAGALAVSRVAKQQQAVKQVTPTLVPSVTLSPSESDATLIYGVWEENQSIIKAINNDGSNHVIIAKLPSNVKDVNVFSDHELIYLAETDDRDHGKKVNVFNLLTQETRTLFEADPGFGIDDIVLSQDKKLVSTLEVKFAPNSEVLSGGDSRVYIVNLKEPLKKTLIVDEKNVSATNPLRYPLFFDSQGRLFLDTFGPNGGGWNLGLWVVNADGSDLKPVPEMEDGKFSIDPIPSPDGTKIVFTAYDPSAYPQFSASPSGILRPAIANPNLLETMDLSNFAKTTLLGSLDGAQYSNPVWSDSQTKIVFEKFKVLNSDDSKYDGIYIYDFLSGKTSEITALKNDSSLEILKFKNGSLLTGKRVQNLGNLGKNYHSLFESFSLVNLSPLVASSVLGATSPLVSGPALQFIDYLGKTPGKPLALNVSPQTLETVSSLTLKLGTFQMKPVAQVRVPQQNLDDVSCIGFKKGMDLAINIARSGKCADTPLYLYPQEETLVTVKVKPPVQIIYSAPEYNNNGWQVLAKPDGELITKEGEIFNKISYTYSTSLDTLPKYGLVVSKENLIVSLEEYAKTLGLMGQEITDFVSFWQENLPNSPYYFISHFNQEESKKILPLEINPKPETLIQVVMYFKPLKQPMVVLPPVFEKIPERKGFVAVDWSGIIDN